MANITESNILLLDSADEAFAKELSKIEIDIYDSVEALLSEFNITKGHFNPKQNPVAVLGKLKKELRSIILNSNYSSSVDDYLRNFDDITKNVSAIQKEFNGIKVAKSLVNPIKEAMVQDTIDNLLGANVDARFANPIRKALLNQINLGGSVEDTRRIIKILITGTKDKDGILRRYAGQVARDSANQYEGALNQTIKDEFDMNATRYVGSLVKDSRPQCVRWVNMEIILDKNLQKEIDRYAGKNGMIPGTTPENFCINRGGYNCRHTAIPTRA